MEIEVLTNQCHSKIPETHPISFAEARRPSSDILFPDDKIQQQKTNPIYEVSEKLSNFSITNVNEEPKNIPKRKPSSANVDSMELTFNASQILPKLWLGNIWDSNNFLELKSRNITHILTLSNKMAAPKFLNEFEYLVIEGLDEENQEILSQFDFCYKWIESAMTAGTVFIHCVAGKSRSPTIVAAYLMKKRAIRMNEALAFIRKQRSQINPNMGFKQQLAIYESLNYDLTSASMELPTVRELMANFKRVSRHLIEVIKILTFYRRQLFQVSEEKMEKQEISLSTSPNIGNVNNNVVNRHKRDNSL